MNYTFAQYKESADYIRSRIGGFAPKVAMVLGSGLGYMGDIVENPIVVPYQDIPHFKVSTAPGHKGQLVFGLGCGVLTVLIRYFGSYPEGVSYAILIMNCCTWGVDKLTRPRQFGVSAEDVKAAKAAKKAAKAKAKEGAANG